MRKVPKEKQFPRSETPAADHHLERLPNVSVIRRFPTYDFVLRATYSVTVASEKLDQFRSSQISPKGFVLTDPRVDGTVSGPTFEIRRKEAALGGSVAPYAEGYFVPTESGSDVFVRVQIPAWWWLFDAFVLAIALVQLGRLSWNAIYLAFLTILALLILTIGPVWLEGSAMARLVWSVMSGDRTRA